MNPNVTKSPNKKDEAKTLFDCGGGNGTVYFRRTLEHYKKSKRKKK